MVDTSSPFDMTDAVIERYVYDDIHNSLASLAGGVCGLGLCPEHGQCPLSWKLSIADGFHAAATLLMPGKDSQATFDQILAQEDVTKTLSDASRTLWPLVDNLGSVRDLAKQDGTIAVHYIASIIVMIARNQTS